MPEPEEDPCWERQLRKQLLLLATVTASFTYAARINPPGGVWPENGPGHNAGDTVLLSSHRGRYLAFCYCNSTALTASVVVIFLLLLKKPRRGAQLVLLRVVMLLDLLSLVGAYAAGSNRDDDSTLHVIYSGIAMILDVALQVFLSFRLSAPPPEQEEEELDERTPLKAKEWRKVLMLLATFTMASAYMAGLSSSGGHRDRIDSSNKQGDDAPVGLDHKAKVRFRAFFYCNTTAFIASLFLVLQLLSHNIVALALSWVLPLHRTLATGIQRVVLYVLVSAVLLGLLGAYAAGNCPDAYTIVFVLCLFAAVLACILLVMAIACCHRQCIFSGATTTTTEGGLEQGSQAIGGGVVVQLGTREDESRKVKSLILLLATMTANITYQAGVDPPGGLWPDNDERDRPRGHYAGEPILMSSQPWRYKVFLYCNSSAFVLSLNAILTLVVYKEHIDNPLLVLMIVDMVALMGSYTAGSWRDARCSIYVVAMAGGVLLYVMTHLLYVTVLAARTTDTGDPRPLEKRHKRLLLVAILVAAITYQAGLRPPGGFRRPHEDGQQAAAGAVLLVDKDPRRIWAFFYCNTVSLVTTMALNLFVVSPNLYRQRAVRYYTLYVCIVLAMLGLMAASSAGIVQTYAYVFVLDAVLVSVIAIRTIRSRSFLLKEEQQEEDDEGSSGLVGPATIPRPRPIPRPRSRFRLRSAQETTYRQAYTRHKHLMLLGVLAASATYQAGFKLKHPAGGLWQEDDGNYLSREFFYINSTSFVTSVFVVAMQLLWRHHPLQSKLLVLSINTALVLDMLGLMAAYAIGVAIKENENALIIMVLLCMPVHAAPWILGVLIKRIKKVWSLVAALR